MVNYVAAKLASELNAALCRTQVNAGQTVDEAAVAAAVMRRQ